MLKLYSETMVVKHCVVIWWPPFFYLVAGGGADPLPPPRSPVSEIDVSLFGLPLIIVIGVAQRQIL